MVSFSRFRELTYLDALEVPWVNQGMETHLAFVFIDKVYVSQFSSMDLLSPYCGALHATVPRTPFLD